MRSLRLIFIILIIGCNSEADQKIFFSDLVELDKIESINISNNKGKHELDENHYTELIYKLGTMIYEPNVALKMGSVSIGLKMESGEHFLIGRTHGDYLEVHRDIVNKNINKIEGSDWLYFKVEGLNIDNY